MEYINESGTKKELTLKEFRKIASKYNNIYTCYSYCALKALYYNLEYTSNYNTLYDIDFIIRYLNAYEEISYNNILYKYGFLLESGDKKSDILYRISDISYIEKLKNKLYLIAIF